MPCVKEALETKCFIMPSLKVRFLTTEVFLFKGLAYCTMYLHSCFFSYKKAH